MIDRDGRWWPDLTKQGYYIFNCYKRYVAVKGPRKSSKSRSIVHKVIRHAHENQGAVAAVLAKTTKVAKSSGVWSTLYQWALPLWVNANIGLRVTKPMTTTDYKMTYFRISCAGGGESEIQLHSLDHAEQVEEKFKGQEFSLIYGSEADQFMDRKAFDRLADQLRGIVPYERAQMILDFNPPEDGEDSWLYDLFVKQLGKLKADGDPMADLYEQIHVPLEDNIFLDPREKAELISRYSNDPIEYKRFILGEYVRDKSKAHFANDITPSHILGDVSHPNKAKWQVLVPSKTSWELYTGWDPGDKNHGVSFGCKRINSDKTVFDIFDEVASINSPVSLSDLTEAVVERMDYWENWMKEEYHLDAIRWWHWGDSSILRYRSGADTDDQGLIRQFSNGRVNIHAVAKGGGSVGRRIKLLKRMLNENMISFSANLPETIRMLKELPKGPSNAELIPHADPRKHMFDALTYMLTAEAPFDMEERQAPKVTTRPIIVRRR